MLVAINVRGSSIHGCLYIDVKSAVKFIYVGRDNSLCRYEHFET